MQRMNQSGRAMCAAVGVVAALSGAQLAQATVTPGTLFGDSYIVTDGPKAYAVMDVYIKCSSSADIISSVFGVSSYQSSFTLNNASCFAQSADQASASSWRPCNNDGSAWDSYLTCGARVQGTDPCEACATICPTLDTNWASSSSGCQVVGQAGGAGWYPCIGASTSTNPYARAGSNGGNGSCPSWWNTAKCTATITGNGITPGQSLNNYWMVGRFSIDITAGSIVGVPTLTLQFCIAGKNNGTTTFTGATQAAGRFNYTLFYGTAGMRSCPSDLDKNGLVDTADISLLLLDLGPCTGCPADLDGNGLVDTADISQLLLDFGPCPS